MSMPLFCHFKDKETKTQNRNGYKSHTPGEAGLKPRDLTPEPDSSL